MLAPKIRLYARPNAINRGSGDYALNITKKLLQFYEDYFKVKYSLPKLGKSPAFVPHPRLLPDKADVDRGIGLDLSSSA